MNWSDWEMLWRRQELPLGERAELTLLHRTFEEKRRKLSKSLFVRDVIEGLGGLGVAIGLAFWSTRMGRAGGWLAAAALLLLGVAAVFLHDGFRRWRLQRGPAVPLLTAIEGMIAELRQQHFLLRHIGKWYLAPWVAILGLTFCGLAQHLQRRAPPGLLREVLTTPLTLTWILVMIAVTAAGLGWWWRGIQHTICDRIEPRLIELEKMRRDLLGKD